MGLSYAEEFVSISPAVCAQCRNETDKLTTNRSRIAIGDSLSAEIPTVSFNRCSLIWSYNDKVPE